MSLFRYQAKIKKGDIEALQDQFEKRASILSKNKVQFAEISGKPVGFVEYSTPCQSSAKIETLHVRPYFRGFGIGRQLVKRVTEEARMMECGRVVLVPFENVRDFYGKLGFRDSDLSTSRTMSLDLR